MADEKNQGDAGAAPEPDALRDFLARLATDPAELGRFVKDPHAAMEAANLSPGDRAILESGNPATIHYRLRGGPTSTAPVTVLVVDATGERAAQTLTVRGAAGSAGLLFPQVVPQIVVTPPLQILPQQVIHPIFPPQQVIKTVVPRQLVVQTIVTR
ncbi:MAG TPA: hypothetical protein VI408_11525, partial [Gaiellaceae bacterium]